MNSSDDARPETDPATDALQPTDSSNPAKVVPATVTAEETSGPPPQFIFVACDSDCQPLCKAEMSRICPDWTPAFSRAGFLTYKLPGKLAERFTLDSTFARTYGFSIQRVDSTSELEAAVASALNQVEKVKHIHVWPRVWSSDPKYSKPEIDADIQSVSDELKKQNKKLFVNQVARPDERILDVVRIDEDKWWIGWHTAATNPQKWVGGIPDLKEPANMVSRAFLKTSEALLWSGIQINRSDICAEVGSAPGGSCQRLLQTGAKVIAIDPAELDPKVASHKNLEYLRMRGREVPHKKLNGVSWLLVDSNVTPTHTLDTVEAMTTGKAVGFRGLLLTLKLTDPKLADGLPEHIARVKSWGFKYVKTRRLAYGRREVCLMALKQKSARRFRK